MRASKVAALALDRALGIRARERRGGKRRGAGRRPRMLWGRSRGDWNKAAVIHSMIELMAPGPFGQEPFAPTVSDAACLAWKSMQDRPAYWDVLRAIHADRGKARGILDALRVDADRWSRVPARERYSVPQFGVRVRVPTWRSCRAYYEKHHAKASRGKVPT